LGLLLSLVVGAEAAGEPGPWLRVIAGDGSLLLSISLASDPSWTLAWPHSVTGTPVSDTFRWHEGRMLLTEHRTRHLDIAGLGLTPGRGEVRGDDQGGFVIAGINEPLPGNVHRIIIGSSLAPTTLWHAGIAYPLSASHAGVRARLEVSLP
jgi:hypothetical protein